MKEQDYKTAITVQSASNLSGVVHSFSEILTRITKEAQEQGKSTDWINQHPICILFAEQIQHLATGKIRYITAYEICEDRASP
ncbi:MAG: hypothetical protein U9N86_17620 [Bacteroidota bacterium]|nr:hypothetical protein [Bacteroidota bacterium]